MRLKSAIFDMDGTLLDSIGAWKDLLPSLLRQCGKEATPELLERLKTVTTQEGAELCKQICNLSWPTSEIFLWFEDQMDIFYSTKIQAKPGVPEFLRYLHSQGVPMCVATATNRRLVETALQRTGIRRYFEGIVTSSEVGSDKSHSPEIYERALERFHFKKADTVVFEDALFAVRTAKNDGFRVAGVYDASAEDEQEQVRALADWYIPSFSSFLTSLRSTDGGEAGR